MLLIREDFPKAEAAQSFAEMGMDSLEFVHLLDRVEDEFGVDMAHTAPASMRDLVYKIDGLRYKAAG